MEDNNNSENLVTELKQDFNIVTTIDNFKIKEEESQNIASSLAKKTAATLAGTFTAKKVGKQKLKAIFSYREGDAVEAFAETEIIAVKLAISLVKPTVLPANLPIKFEQELEFLVNNPTEFEATKIEIEEIEGLVGISIIEEKPNDSGYEVIGNPRSIEEFKKNSEVKLDAKHQFRVKGKINTAEAGAKILKLLVKYAELEYLDDADKNKEGAKFEKTINVQAIEVVGVVATQFPAKIKLGSEYEVVFQFTNQNTEFPVTGVNITVKEEVPTAEA